MRATYIELLDPRPRSIATLSWHFKNEVLSSDILSAQSNARAYPSTTSSWPFRGMLRDCVYDQANTQRYFCFALPAIIGPVLASLLLHGGGLRAVALAEYPAAQPWGQCVSHIRGTSEASRHQGTCDTQCTRCPCKPNTVQAPAQYRGRGK